MIGKELQELCLFPFIFAEIIEFLLWRHLQVRDSDVEKDSLEKIIFLSLLNLYYECVCVCVDCWHFFFFGTAKIFREGFKVAAQLMNHFTHVSSKIS